MPPKTPPPAGHPRRATRVPARRSKPHAAVSSPSSAVKSPPSDRTPSIDSPSSILTTEPAAASPSTPATRATRRPVSHSSVEEKPPSVAQDRSESRNSETLDGASSMKVAETATEANAVAGSPSFPTTEAAALLSESTAVSVSLDTGSALEFAESITTESVSEGKVSKPETTTTCGTQEASPPHKSVEENAGETAVASGVAAVSGNDPVALKPGVKKTVRVVKKMVKRKVLKKVPKSLQASSRKESEKARAEEVAEPPNSILLAAKEGENPNSSMNSDKLSRNVEFQEAIEIFNPSVVSVEQNENYDSNLRDNKQPVSGEICIHSVEEVKSTLPMDVEAPFVNEVIAMEIEKPHVPEGIDGLKGGHTVDDPSVEQFLGIDEVSMAEFDVSTHVSDAETDTEIPRADQTEENNDTLDSGDVAIKEEGGKCVALEVCKRGDMSNELMVLSEELEALERKKRRMTELFIGGLDKHAKEEDIRKVFEEVGKLLEVRLVMNGQTEKNKGFAFLRYASATDAKKALELYSKVKICGKECNVSPVEGNDTIFLGNLDKTWKNEDVLKLLHDVGIEKIDAVTVMTDPNNMACNRGFGFLELETKRDAQIAFRKLQKKDVFGKNNITIAWAEPLSEPDEEEMLKVKAVYAEFVPSSWDDVKVRGFFKRFGKVESVVLSRNLHFSKRKDFAFVHFATREAALSCIESFSRELLDVEGSKVNIKVSIAKPLAKRRQSKRTSDSVRKEISKEKLKAAKTPSSKDPRRKGKFMGSARSNHQVLRGDRGSSTNAELIQLLRDQAIRNQSHAGLGLGSVDVDYPYSLPYRKRPFSHVLGDEPVYSDPRGYPRARLDNSYSFAGPSYDTLYHRAGVSSLSYHGHHISDPRSGYGHPDYASNIHGEEAPYRGIGGLYHRYR